MSPDIRFIPYASQTDTDIFPLQCSGNAASYAGLTGTGCTNEEQDRSGLFSLQVHNCNLLNHTALDFLQPVMIRLQHIPGFVQVDDFRLCLLPVQRCNEVQIIIQHSVLRRLVSLLLQAIEYLGCLCAGSLVHPGFLDLHLKLPDIRDLFRVHFIQLTLQVLQLLLDGGFFIDILVLLLMCGIGVVGYFGNFQELIDQFFHQFRTMQAAVFLQDLIVLLIGGLHPD